MREPSVVIVGGGISGLTVAYFLSKQDPSLKITVLEASERLGGVLRTLHARDFLIEAGADSFDGRDPAIREFVQELGLWEERLPCEPSLKRLSLETSSGLYPVELSYDGLKTLFQNPSFSFKARLRLLLEPIVPALRGMTDESLASFVSRRFGHEILERFIRPALQGVLLASPEDLSVAAYFPDWVKTERTPGGLAKNLWRNKGGAISSFLTFRDGLESLVKALTTKLRGVDLQTHARVVSAKKSGDWDIRLEDGRVLTSKVLCLALPGPSMARLLSGIVPDLAAEVGQIRYHAFVTVPMVFPKDAIPAKLQTPGFIVPSHEKKWSFASLKVIGPTEDGAFIRLRVFLSEAFQPESLGWEDARIREEVLETLQREWGIQEKPLWFSVERYPEALPHYALGHFERVAGIEGEARKHEGLYLTGNGFHGFGISECIRNAKLMASNIESYSKPVA